MLKLDHFTLELFNEDNEEHVKLKNAIIDMKDSDLISKNIDAYIRRNKDLGAVDNITRTYVVAHDNDYIGLTFVNYHPEEVINGKKYSEEIEIGLGILPKYRNKGLGSSLERELSDKLLEIFPRFRFIVAKIDNDKNPMEISVSLTDGTYGFKETLESEIGIDTVGEYTTLEGVPTNLVCEIGS